MRLGSGTPKDVLQTGDPGPLKRDCFVQYKDSLMGQHLRWWWEKEEQENKSLHRNIEEMSPVVIYTIQLSVFYKRKILFKFIEMYNNQLANSGN